MIKKILALLLLVLPLCMQAQFGTGKWVIHPRYAINAAQNVIDAGDKVYFLVSNCLYSLDKATKVITNHNKATDLNDVLITGIYYNYDKHYLVVTYDDSNIDIIKSDGTVLNLPAVKDVVLAVTSKSITDVSFAPGKMYVSTLYGWLQFNDNDFSVAKSAVWKRPVHAIAEVGKFLFINLYANFYYAPLSDDPMTPADFKTAYIAEGKYIPIDANSFFLKKAGALDRVSFSENSDGSLFFTINTAVGATATNVQRTPSGFIANFFSTNAASCYYYTFDTQGLNGVKTSGGQALYSCDPQGDGTMWNASAQGLSSSADPATHYKPNAVEISGVPFWMTYNTANGKLYLTSTADYIPLDKLSSAYYNAYPEVCIYNGSTWESHNPQGTAKSNIYGAVIAPGDKTNTYWTTTRLGLVYKIVDDVVKNAFTSTSAMAGWVARRPCLQFDDMGNLWVMSTSMSTTATVKVLPAAKVNSANIAASDWKIYNIPHLADVNDFKRSSLAVAKGSNIKVGTNGCYNQPLVFWKNNDNDVTDGNCDYRVFSALTDQNGKSFTNWTYNHALVADSTGNVVYGSTIGLVMFNPADAFAADKPFTVTQLDELSGIEVTTIAVDKQNRKWVGTIGSGIYLVSPDCKTVLKHFTTDNSPLSSNEIYYLCCNTSNNSVFIVTPSSIMQYYADYTESASSYSNVYAYPNPVRPDFTGFITITGLMENSTVVIKDANGKIVKQLTSTGGMATWDGCDSNGERLPTGSYAVYAAQGAASLPVKPCTKVMIIK